MEEHLPCTQPSHRDNALPIHVLPCALIVFEAEGCCPVVQASPAFWELIHCTKKDAGKPRSLKHILSPEGFAALSEHTANQDDFQLEAGASPKNGVSLLLSLQCTRHPCVPNRWIAGVQDITAAQELRRQCDIMEEEQRIVMQQTGRVIIKFDVATKTLYQPKQAADMFGLPCVCRNVPYSIARRLLARESEADYLRFYESMMAGNPHGSSIVRMKNITGNYAWYAMKYTLTYDAANKPFRGIISYEDVTELQKKEIAYKKWREYFKAQREDSLAYYEYDLSRDSFESMLGDFTADLPAETLHSFTSIVQYAAAHFIYPADREAYLAFFSRNQLLAQYYTGQTDFQLEHRRLNKDGKIFWALASVQLISDPYTNTVKASVMMKDIDLQKRSLLTLRHRSDTDPLTGLLNRIAMERKMNALFQNSAPGEQHIFLIMDIDHFKGLNDRMGHPFGDRVLCDIAKRLQNGVRSCDLCARLGGDEFVVLLTNTSFDAKLSNRLQKLCTMLARTYENGASTSGSLGLAVYPRDGRTFYELYEKADIALYQAKRSGRNRFVFYECKKERPFSV